MSQEAMKLALEALEWCHGGEPCGTAEAITALREALEEQKSGIKQVIELYDSPDQPAQQEPVAFYVYKPTLPRGNLGNVSDGDLPWVYDQDPSSGYSARMLVYTTPPQRTWVGLTDEEISKMPAWIYSPDQDGMTAEEGLEVFARTIETKLKEKNT